ncbi:somatostatin-1-like, partial [Astyanax mexicanus]
LVLCVCVCVCVCVLYLLYFQAPGDYSFPDYVVRLFMNSRQSKPENSAPFGERSVDETDITKRQEENLDEFNSFDTKSDEKKRKPGCKNYFWKSWTAC